MSDRTLDDYSPDALRKLAELPAFEHDVFISWRMSADGIANGERVGGLEGRLIKRLGIYPKIIENPPDLDEEQRRVVQTSRIVIVMLDSTGLYAGTKFGQQYKELVEIAEIKRKALDETGIAAASDVPFIFPVYFYNEPSPEDAAAPHHASRPRDPDTLRNPREIIDALLPGRLTPPRDGFAHASEAVRAMLLPPAWTFVSRKDVNSGVRWADEIIAAIRAHGARAGLTLIQDGAGSAGRAGAPPPIPSFDYQSYLDDRVNVWRHGGTSFQHERRATAREGSVSLRVAASERLPLRGALVGVEDGRQLAISDVAAFVAESSLSLMLVGQAGAGKTNVITEAAVAEAMSVGPSGTRARYPFVFQLKLLLGRIDVDAVVRSLTSLIALHLGLSGDDEEALDRFLRERPCTFYFDGFDELNESERIAFVDLLAERSDGYRDVRVVLSCRPGYEDPLLSFFAVVRLHALVPEDIDLFIRRQPALRNRVLESSVESLRAIFANTKALSDGVRTPLFLRLYLEEDRNDRTPGNGPIVYVKTLAHFFQRLAGEQDGARRELAGLDQLAAFTQLAYDFVRSGRIRPEVIERVASGPDQAYGEVRKKRLSFLYDRTGLIRQEGNFYAFEHAILAEYLVARDLAHRWREAVHGGEAAQRAYLKDIFGENEHFEVESPLIDLIDRIPCIYFDDIAFPPADIVSAERGQLATGLCIAVSDAVFEARLGPLSLARAGKAFLMALRAADAIRSSVFDKPALQHLSGSISNTYRHHADHWPIDDREPILSTIADIDEALWQRSAGIVDAPVEIPEAEVPAAAWVRSAAPTIVVPAFRVQRRPVTVGEFEAFATATNRYDDAFWPLRSDAQRHVARTQLIAPAHRAEPIGSGVDGNDCVVADAPITNAARQHWPQQLRHRHRPVVNVTWRESVAFVLWSNHRDSSRVLRLPGPVEWISLVAALEAAGTPELHDPVKANIGATRFHAPTTIGAFPANALGLFDFAVNVGVWLATQQDDNPQTRWPPEFAPGQGPRVVLAAGSWFRSTNALLNRAPKESAPYIRHDHVGIWLVERT